MLKHWTQPRYNTVRLLLPNTSCPEYIDAVKAQAFGMGLQLLRSCIVGVQGRSHLKG